MIPPVPARASSMFPVAFAALATLLAIPAPAQEPVPSRESPEKALPARKHFFALCGAHLPQPGLLGGTHLHTGMSLDAKGKVHEKVYDAAWGDADRRRADAATGNLTPVGSTVDVASATWTNTIGDPELIPVWKDPEFDPSLRAFYRARVLEIPIPRWTAYAAKRYGITMPPEVPMITQERAYTSPIWYTP